MAAQLTPSGTCQPGSISSMPQLDKGEGAKRPRPSIRDTDAGLLVLGLTQYLDSLNLGEGPFDLGLYSRNLASPSGTGLVQNYKLLSALLPNLDHGLVRQKTLHQALQTVVRVTVPPVNTTKFEDSVYTEYLTKQITRCCQHLHKFWQQEPKKKAARNAVSGNPQDLHKLDCLLLMCEYSGGGGGLGLSACVLLALVILFA